MSEITYTILAPELCQPVMDLIEICFPTMDPEDQHSVEELEEAAEIFPEGTIVALDGDRVIGMGMGFFLNVDFDNLPPKETDLLYTLDESNHDPDADYYYGSDLAVHPDYRGPDRPAGDLSERDIGLGAVCPGLRLRWHSAGVCGFVHWRANRT